MSKQKKSIANLFSSVYIAVIIVLTITIGSLFIINRILNFYKNSKDIESEFLTSQAYTLRQKLDEIIADIEYNKDLANKTLKAKIKARVYEAHHIAEKIYNDKKDTQSPQKIRETIKDTLSLLRFHDSRGYYFIKDFDNNPILYPPNREVEGQPASQEDPMLKHIDVIKSRGEGFVTYRWFKPGEKKIKEKKITYVKLFKPYNWIICTGEYADAAEEETRASLIEKIKNITFGKEGKYSIFAFEIENIDNKFRFGPILLEPKDRGEIDRHLSDILMGKKSDRIAKEILEKVSRQGEGKTNIKSGKNSLNPYPVKIIYYKLYPGWNFVFGAGFYPGEFNETISDNKKRLAKDIKTEIFLIIALLVVVLFIAILISNFFSKKIKNEFNIFADSLDESAKKNKPLDKKQLHVAEFLKLADSANRMISRKKKGEEALRTAKEMAEAATRLKSEFLANMSHEIRTPMNAIVGMSDLLYQTDITEDQLEYIDIINSSSKKLLTIINDILDLSKIESGKFNLDAVNFNLRDVVEEVSDIVAIEAHKKNLELIIFLETDIPMDLIGDPSRLHQILLNLVNNAVKFTEEGEIVISAQKEEEWNNHVKILFKVRDTGIGISVEDKKKLFSSFSQIDSTSTRKYGGTGLGLAISKKLTELMRGEIGVDSREMMGSTFWFTAAFEKAETLRKKERRFMPGFKDLRVMIIDDNETNRLTLRSCLRSWGSRCHCTGDGEEAVAKMQTESTKDRPFHVALLDYRVPGFTGEEIAAIIRKDPEITDPKLILLSPTNIHKSSDELQKGGIDALLNKPVKQSHLFNSIARVMGFDQHIRQITKDRMIIRTAKKVDKNQPLHILVVEDNVFNQKVVIYNLKKFGHKIDVAENGKIAVERYKNNNYDLILMDIQMPEMDGHEATRIIRLMEKEAKEKQGKESYTPIIAMTANAMKEDEEKSLKSGMDAHLSKPFNSEKFLDTIKKFVDMNPSRLVKGNS